MEHQVLVIGNSTIDIIASKVSAAVFVTGHASVQSVKMSYGGDGLNEAVVLSHMGVPVSFISALGNDEGANSIVQYAQKQKVDLLPVYKDTDTAIVSILVDEKGNRNLINTPDSSIRKLVEDDISFPLEESVKLVSFASIFISKAMSISMMESLFRKIKKENKILCADTTTPKNGETDADLKNCLQYLDYFFPNEKEACMLTQTENVIEAAERLYQAGVKNVVIKCGAKGCYLKNSEISQYCGCEKVENVVDTTGAGDSFVAGFIAALLKNKSFIECAAFANQCGAKAVGKVGSTTWITEGENL